MKPYSHAVNSVKRYGGSVEDYLAIHDWFDSTKAAYADTRHRAILHNTFGTYLAEQVFGHVLVNSDGRKVHVRNVAEDHVVEDCGFIPTIERWLSKLELQPWMPAAQPMPYEHAVSSAARFGGTPSDYLAIHDWFDSVKKAWADPRRLALLNNTFGIYLAEQVFGHTLTNGDGAVLSVRTVAEAHVEAACGRIPTLDDWLAHVPAQDWMRGRGMKKRMQTMELQYD